MKAPCVINGDPESWIQNRGTWPMEVKQGNKVHLPGMICTLVNILIITRILLYCSPFKIHYFHIVFILPRK